jgi:hypothetical protein
MPKYLEITREEAIILIDSYRAKQTDLARIVRAGDPNAASAGREHRKITRRLAEIADVVGFGGRIVTAKMALADDILALDLAEKDA